MDNGIMFDEVKNIKSREIIDVVRRTLCYIDSRLVEHGERVAFIIYQMLSYSGTLDDYDWRSLMLLAVFHDIGAYKTDEIDNMVSFETTEYYDHSVYGYLFLKLMTPLKDFSEAILYHHTKYEHLVNLDTDYKDYAQLIHLADRVDILNQGGADPVPYLIKESGIDFDPRFVDMFIVANKSLCITAECINKNYRKLIKTVSENIKMSESMMFDYLKMIVFSIDFRSPYTVAHTINTTAIGISIAKLSGLSSEEIRDIGYGAFLHDLGKIAIPLEILESPDKLNDEDMEIMKTHVVITDKIIRGVVNEKVCNIAVRHHEKLDGSGYPLSLKAENLTYSERILAVADIISALIGTRSYKKPFPKEKVIEILKDMSEFGKISSDICKIVFEYYDVIMESAEEYLRPTSLLYNQLISEYNRFSGVKLNTV